MTCHWNNIKTMKIWYSWLLGRIAYKLLFCIVCYCIACLVLHCIELNGIALHCTILYWTALHCTTTAAHRTVQYFTVFAEPVDRLIESIPFHLKKQVNVYKYFMCNTLLISLLLFVMPIVICEWNTKGYTLVKSMDKHEFYYTNVLNLR